MKATSPHQQAEYQKTALSEALQKSPPFVSFKENGPLASLCFCIALQRELEDPRMDRLSHFFGVRPSPGVWNTKIHLSKGEWAISGRLKSQQTFEFRHPDLAMLLGPGTIILPDGPVKWTIIPSMVAGKVAKKRIELGIVRDWFLDSVLHSTKNNMYLITNELELHSLYGKTQANIMRRGQLAFQGTHDIVDHLFGLNADRYLGQKPLYELCYSSIKNAGLSCEGRANSLPLPEAKKIRLHYKMVVYTMGVLLDDLAQPRWYHSQKHVNALVRCMRSFENPSLLPQKTALEVVEQVMSDVRR